MATPSDIGADLAQEFFLAACKVGFEPKDLTALAQNPELFKQVLSLVRGHTKTTEHIIDCDAEPPSYKDFSVKMHCKGGQVIWNRHDVRLYVPQHLVGNQRVTGFELLKVMNNLRPCNACILHWLLEHQDQIPKDWKRDTEYPDFVFFWGTTYRVSSGHLYVLGLYFDSHQNRWQICYRWLGGGFYNNDYAAIFTS